MRVGVLFLLLLSFGAFGSDSALAADPVAEKETTRVVAQLSRHYEAVHSFSARFVQTFKLRAQDKEQVRTGTIHYARRSKISFRYDKPYEGRIVSDGRRVRIWDKASARMYETDLKRAPHPALLAFLAGDGELAASFRLRLIDPRRQRVKTGRILEATPKEATPSFHKLLFYLADDGAVLRVMLLDAQGNANRFVLSEVKINPKIPKREFRFTPPNGTKIVKP
jgi:outer membrane lipoprotein carrier protein